MMIKQTFFFFLKEDDLVQDDWIQRLRKSEEKVNFQFGYWFGYQEDGGVSLIIKEKKIQKAELFFQNDKLKASPSFFLSQVKF